MRTTPRPGTMTEKTLQECVRRLAKLRSWLYYHTHRSQFSPAGFPDVIAIKGDRLVVAELKSDKGKVSPEQQEWLEAFARCGVEVHIWRPSDWQDGTIEAVLA